MIYNTSESSRRWIKHFLGDGKSKYVWTNKIWSNTIEFEIRESEQSIPVKGLQAFIKTSKKTYKYKEDIKIEYILKNVGSKDLIILHDEPRIDEDLYLCGYTLKITDLIGRNAIYKEHEIAENIRRFPEKSDFKRLKPEESVRGVIKNLKFHLNKTYFPQASGKYKITFICEKGKVANKYGKKFNLTPWTGKIVSNILEIKIIDKNKDD